MNVSIFSKKGEDLLRLDKTEGEHAIGDVVTGFVYVDKDEHRRLTTLEQKQQMSNMVGER